MAGINMRVSPSSLGNFLGNDWGPGCHRKWAGRKLAELTTTETEAQASGKRRHAMLEQYVQDGTPIPLSKEGQTCLTAIPHIPAGMVTELELWWDSFGVPWIGILDGLAFAGPKATIADYKTTGNPRNAKSEHQLSNVDHAALLYSHAVYTIFPEIQSVEGLWIYIFPKGPARPVQFDCGSRDKVADRVEKELAPAAREMLGYSYQYPERISLPVWNTIKANPNACGMIGQGCDFGIDCKRFTSKGK